MNSSAAGSVPSLVAVGYLGPPGTFTEEALLSQTDLCDGKLLGFPTVSEVLGATQSGDVDLGFVPLENAIEGTVNITLDHLVFDHELFIQREVILGVHLHLMAKPGVGLGAIKRVASFPVASAQCRKYLSKSLADAELVASNSTADAARIVGAGELVDAAAIAPALCAKLYGLEIIDRDVEDHAGNETRFVAVARSTIPPPTGHDKTSIVCFQDADRPGNLHTILGQFAARGINLTKLESRPTKKGLGDYCFVVDLEGHISDEIVADVLKELHAQLREVKFLGSYPAGGPGGAARREAAGEAWRVGESWVSSLRTRVRPVH
ncbi:MAG TPA: prephenate dehydratase [Acidimicrobiales bacterium]|nr:prephenate dehydratase [Acidimicrobiales bacterium]